MTTFVKNRKVKTIEFDSAQHVKIEYELSTGLQRLIAALIDFIAFTIYDLLMLMVFDVSSVFADFGTQLFVVLLLIKLPWIFYGPICEFFTGGQTLGKYAMGIRVVTFEGERPGLKEVFARWLFKGDFLWISADFFLLFWFGLGVLGGLFLSVGKYNQRLCDIVAGTVVVRNKPAVTYRLEDILSIQKNYEHQPTYLQVVRFTDEEMLLIKNTIQRVKKYPNEETKRFAVELSDKAAQLIGLDATPPKRLEFLQTLLLDYVALTR